MAETETGQGTKPKDPEAVLDLVALGKDIAEFKKKLADQGAELKGLLEQLRPTAPQKIDHVLGCPECQKELEKRKLKIVETVETQQGQKKETRPQQQKKPWYKAK